MISSGALPKLALRKPPIPGPVCSAACSVASPIRHASGTSASAASTKSIDVPALKRSRRREGGREPSDVQRADARAERLPIRQLELLAPLARAVCQVLRSRQAPCRRPLSARHSRPDAPAPSAGRDGVPPLRGALRQGRLPGGVPRALVPLRLLVRGVGHTYIGCMQKLRRRDRPRDAGGRRSGARGLRRIRALRRAAADVRDRGGETFSSRSRSRGVSIRSSASCRRGPTFRVFAQLR